MLITIAVLHLKLFYAISVDCSNSPLMPAYSLKLNCWWKAIIKK